MQPNPAIVNPNSNGPVLKY